LELQGSELRWERSHSEICSLGSADIFYELFVAIEDDLHEDEVTHRQLLVG